MAARRLPRFASFACDRVANGSSSRLGRNAPRASPHGETVLSAARVAGREILVPTPRDTDAFPLSVGGELALAAGDAPDSQHMVRKAADNGNIATLTLADTPAAPLSGDAAAAPGIANAAHAARLGMIERAGAVAVEHRAKQAGQAAAAPDQPMAGAQTQRALTPARVTTAIRSLQPAAVSRATLRAADAAIALIGCCTRLSGPVGDTGPDPDFADRGTTFT